MKMNQIKLECFRKALFFIVVSFAFFQLNAQTIQLQGKVTDKEGLALPGVNVVIKGSAKGVITDVNGKYTISVNADDVVVFSFIGFKPQEFEVGQKTNIDVVLELTSIGLDEVVAVGYGTVKKTDLTGSVASVKSEQISEVPVASVDQALQGRISGMNVINTSGMPGASVSIRIRGSNSIIGNNEPLFVVDGVPYYNDNSAASSGSLTGDQSNSEAEIEDMNVLSSLNPNDIASVEVLKDASATAIYGSRGANGVIIITTKQGSKGKSKINYQTWVGISEIQNKPDMMEAKDYAEYRNVRHLFENPDFDPEKQNLPFPGKTIGEGEDAYYLPGPEDFDYSTDWLDEVTRTGISQSHNLSFNGSNGSTRYLLSGEYFEQKGVVKKSDLERMSARLNLNHDFSKKLKIAANIFYSNMKNTTQPNATGQVQTNAGAVIQAIKKAPTNKVYDENGDYWVSNDPTVEPSEIFTSPVSQLEGTDMLYTIDQFTSSFKGDFELVKGLKFNTRLGYILYSNKRDAFYGYGSWLGNNTNGVAIKNSNITRKTNWDNYLSFNKTFTNKHTINAVLGTSWETGSREMQKASARDFSVDALGYNALQAGAVPGLPYSERTESELLSYYARINYSYNGKYLLTFTGRADGSSKFATNKKWGYFPSGAFAWRVSEEEFMKSSEKITNLKLRTSYGLTGNQAINPYQSLATLGFYNYNLDNGLVTGVGPSSMANPDLTWEKTAQFNAGFDFGIIDNRYRLIFDYYNKTTTDLLWFVNLPATTGFGSALSNLGEVVNSGFEFTIQADVVDKKDFRFGVDINLSTNKNKVLDLGKEDLIKGAPLSNNAVGFMVHAIKVNEPLNSFWLYEEDGYLTQADIDNGYAVTPGAKAGDIKYVDQLTVDTDGDGIPDAADGVISDDDKKILGKPFPDYTYGLGLNFAYKNFNLDLLISGSEGASVYNVNKQITEAFGDVSSSWNKVDGFMENTWTPENQNALYPSMASRAGHQPGQRYLEDASFLKLSNVKLTYNFQDIVKNISWINNLQMYVTGRNLLTFTDYSGFDPEVSAFGQDPRRPMVDMGGYPSIRTVVFGLNVSF